MQLNRKFLPEIILVNTQLPENLGATARGMLNFKFDKIRLVKPEFKIDNEKIIPVSAGAKSVIKKIKTYEYFQDSIKDLNIIIGTSNRQRTIKKNEITFRKLSSLVVQEKNKIGIVFGPEQSGLNNDDLSLCDYTLRIETNPSFSSMNLSHAVTTVCHNLFNLLFTENKKSVNFEVLAKKKTLILFYTILERALENSNFFNVKERKKILFEKIKNIFSKNKLTHNEVKILISIFKKFVE
mgnify:FL=1